MNEDTPLLVLSSQPSSGSAHHSTRAGASAASSNRKLLTGIFLVSVTVAGFLSYSSLTSRSFLHQERQRAGPLGVIHHGGTEEKDEQLAVKEGNGAMSGTRKPNVFFIMIDDMGWDDIGYQSTDLKGITPNLDKLAAGGVKMTNYYSMSICTPARATLMTGRYTVRYGMQYADVIMPGQPWGVPLSEKLFPEYLNDAGYESHMVGKWHLGGYSSEHLPSQRGFDTYKGYLGGSERYWSRNSMEVIMEGGRTFVDFGFGNATGYFDITERPINAEGVSPDRRGLDLKRQYSTDEFQARTLEILAAKSPHDEKPLFMYLAHQAVHKPLGLPPDGSFTDEEVALLDAVGLRDTDDIQGNTRRWFAEVAMYLDKKVGELVGLLEKEGWLENSIIVVASDNGGDPGAGGSNYPLRGMKHTYWEGGMKVPAFVYSKSHIPEEARGTEYHGLMHVADWLPTIASAAGIEARGSAGALDGVNQWSHIVDPALAHADEAGENYPRTEILHNFDPYSLLSDPNEEIDPLQAQSQGAYRYGKYKMHFSAACQAWYTNDKQVLAQDPLTDLANVCGGTCDPDGTCGGDDDDEELLDLLFDIEADPRETTNLIDDLPDVAQELRDRWYNVTFQEYSDTVYRPTNVGAYDVWISYNWWIAPWFGRTGP